MGCFIVAGNDLLQVVDASVCSFVSHHSVQSFFQGPLHSLYKVTFRRVIGGEKIDTGYS